MPFRGVAATLQYIEIIRKKYLLKKISICMHAGMRSVGSVSFLPQGCRLYVSSKTLVLPAEKMDMLQ